MNDSPSTPPSTTTQQPTPSGQIPTASNLVRPAPLPVAVGSRQLSYPLPDHDEVIANWPLLQAQLPSAPNAPFPKLHWDWRAINSQPQIDPTAWVAAGSVVYGRVKLGPRSSIWYHCVLRGDQEWIEIGTDTNVQDGSVLHIEHGGYPCILGDRVTLGHSTVVHGCIVGNDALIGIGAIVLSKCVIGEGALIAAGAVVMEGTYVPPHTLWAGCPARKIKDLSPHQQERLAETYQHYVNNTASHRSATIAGILPK